MSGENSVQAARWSRLEYALQGLTAADIDRNITIKAATSAMRNLPREKAKSENSVRTHRKTIKYFLNRFSCLAEAFMRVRFDH